MNTLVPRRCGETTRIADRLIQNLFLYGEAEIEDHHDSRESNKDLLDIIANRLKNEHSHVNFNADYTNMKIKLIENE